MSPKLSIITINYNNSSGIEKTIKSVLSQTSRDFEYIIVDGKSTDGSCDVIQDILSVDDDRGLVRTGGVVHVDGILVKWISEKDKGIYHAMNKGIRMAVGEFCQFLNSGDWLSSETVVERSMDVLPDCSIFYGNMSKYMPDGRIVESKSASPVSMFTFYKGSLNHSPDWIKRSLFEKYGLYDEGLRIVSDWKWYLKVIGLHNETAVHNDMMETCFDMTGISNTEKDLERKERRMVLEELLPHKILADYDRYYSDMMMMERINRNKAAKRVVWFLERVLFKFEKWKTRSNPL